LVPELDGGQHELWVVVDEQAGTGIEPEQLTAGRVHPRIRLVAPEHLGDDEAGEYRSMPSSR
jgi:hypothetical protein